MAQQPNSSVRGSLYLVDGHSHLYKAFYGVRGLSTSRGLPTNAVFGFVRMLHRLIEARQPDYLGVVFDTPTPSFRNEIYPEYKANRPAQPEDLSVQIPWVKQILEEMNLAIVEMPGYEADDVMATLAERANAEGLDVWIVSADKDLMQLVKGRIRMLRMEPDSEIVIDAIEVRRRMSVEPQQITDLLGLMGDSSDNIPGVPKVGEKTAAAILAQFPTIESVYAHLDQLANSRFQKLLEGHRDEALLSKHLATLKRDLPLPIEIEDLRRREPNVAGLRAIYEELEFKSALGGLLLHPTHPPLRSDRSDREVNYRTIADEATLRQFVEAIKSALGGWLSVDTETSEVDPMRAELVGISLSIEPNKAVYVPIGHSTLGGPDFRQLALGRVREILGPALADPAIPKTGQNLKYDMKILARHGLPLAAVAFDTLVAAYLLDPDRSTHGLKALARDRLGITMTAIEELIGSGKKQVSMADVEIERVSPYACADADAALQLTHLLEGELREKGLISLFEQIELPLMALLNRMEMTGVRIDTGHFAAVSAQLSQRLGAVAQEIYGIAGRTFNISSPKQVGEVLFRDMGLRPVRAGKTGYSTDVSVLEQLARQSESGELPKKILEYRALEKIKSTYADALPKMVNPHTGRIHTSYNQTIAATGRLSSSEPNLQNIPVRTPEGRAIRQGFIPLEDGHVLMAADYSQIELRVLAHFTRDPSLVEAFRKGLDIHRLTASRVFGCPPEEVAEEMRAHAKVVNFGIIYGMSAHGLAEQLEIPRTQAARFIEEYFKAYPGVKRWEEEVVSSARQSGYVTTLSGRRRAIANIASRNQGLRAAAERVAINTPIQGTAADLIKIAMIAVDRRLRQIGSQAEMIMQVHDELIFDLPEAEVETVRQAVCEEMEAAMALDVPLKVDVKVGQNWEEC